MRTLSFWLINLYLVAFLSQTVMAQDNVMTNEEFGVSFTGPEGWVSVEGNDRAIFNIKHEESQSQIEVIATNLMSPDVASIFFDTFHNTLTQSNFTQISQEESARGEHTGTMTTYSFEYAGVALNVVIFQFTNETTAFLIVGYVKADEMVNQEAAFNAVAASISLNE
jgi:hypothetical protein